MTVYFHGAVGSFWLGNVAQQNLAELRVSALFELFSICGVRQVRSESMRPPHLQLGPLTEVQYGLWKGVRMAVFQNLVLLAKLATAMEARR